MPALDHLYVHIPFCAAKCHYCAFYSEAGHAAQMSDFAEALRQELAASPAPLAPRTVFFGGGTPSILPAPVMQRILEKIPASQVTEWTVECNPSTVTTEKARLYREYGVNRISLGVQALDDEMLARLGRVHSVAAAVRSYENLRAAGFDNINLDLIFGLPGQTRTHWERTLEQVLALQPDHIATYCLILEEDTHYWSLFQQGLLKPDEDEELVLYELALDRLAAAGYRQYEISNFARPGRECRHNLAYWEGKDYLGLGPGACSTVGDWRWQNQPDLERYLQSPGAPPVAYREALTPERRAAECAAFGMRMNAGIPAELVRGRWDAQVAELLSAELVQWRDGRLAPTRRGLLFADAVAAEFV